MDSKQRGYMYGIRVLAVAMACMLLFSLLLVTSNVRDKVLRGARSLLNKFRKTPEPSTVQ